MKSIKPLKNGDDEQAKHFAKLLKTLAEPLNIAQSSPTEFLQAVIGDDNGLSEDEILAKIDERKQAKTNKDFAKADQNPWRAKSKRRRARRYEGRDDLAEWSLNLK